MLYIVARTPAPFKLPHPGGSIADNPIILYIVRSDGGCFVPSRIPLLIALLPAALAAQARITVPLDGEWRIGESVSPDRMPAAFDHAVAVPGLVNQARPAFPAVDEFDSRERIDRKVRAHELPASARITAAGISKQPRDYFWYRRTFRAPGRKQTAILRIGKAQFGTQVWLNGTKIGDHNPCFSAGTFDLTRAIRWDGENTLTVRIGAHPAVLPKDIVAGTDFEKLKWTPGIYDRVTLLLSDNPVIETVQTAPRLADNSVVVQTAVRNYGSTPAALTLQHRIQRSGETSQPEAATLAPGESRTFTTTIRIAQTHLWSPEDPFLYTVETSTGGDTLATRFGMREFRFDTATKRAYLNGRPYFLRGSNITLHRFFEDPKAGALPWNEAWVRKLLIDIPKRMHWNSFRFCIGPVPDFWMDIADEAGLLIQNEFFIWVGGENEWYSWHREWTAPSLAAQFREWMRDNWNHPSQAIWDASNESEASLIGKEVIPAVRKLDLSGRPWDNGYTLPSGPDDPVEDHPYLFSRGWDNPNAPVFSMTELERMTGGKTPSTHPTGHAVILNEYGWLWVNRDGSPAELTTNVYAKLLGPNAKPEDRIELDNYLVAGLTEFWRAHRNFAGVLHFVYLTCSYPGVFTSDHFRDVEKLELHPQFEQYLGEAFKPLGVYINFWQPKVAPGSRRKIAVMLANDTYDAADVDLTFSIERGPAKAVQNTKLAVPALGQQTWRFDVEFPSEPGDYILRATARHAGAEPTVSFRKFRVE